jgi:phosphoserine aminotransferase
VGGKFRAVPTPDVFIGSELRGHDSRRNEKKTSDHHRHLSGTMPTREQVINFGPGPASLPTPVLEQASKDLLNYNDIGMSLAEISHRSSTANNILANANSHLRELLEIPDTHEIIWQQGGGTAQFSMVAYNLAAAYIAKGGNVTEMTSDYLITGGWSKKAYEEAVRLGIGKVNVVTDSRKVNGGKFGVIEAEKDWNWSDPKHCAYVYYCDNETVDGVEFPGVLQSVDPNVPVVCDMSSNILSRKVDISKFAVIYVSLPSPYLF